MLSIHYFRQVTELRVFCRDSECDWQGELSQLERHMQSNHGLGCNFTSMSDLTRRFLSLLYVVQSSSQASTKDVPCEESGQEDGPSTSGVTTKAHGSKSECDN